MTNSMQPYTPDAMKHVRQCASSMPATTIADQLGWDLATLRERARRHGIELLAPMPTANTFAELKAVLLAPVAPAATADTGRSGLRAIPVDGDLHQVIASLPPRQADVLTVLSQLPPGVFMSGAYIAGRLEVAICAQGIADCIGRLKRRLAETRRWRIESRQRRGGGHRLVDLSKAEKP